MSAALGVSLVGAGAIGALRAAAVARTPGLALVAVADARPEAAQALAQRFGGLATTDGLQAATDPRAGLVVVSTPPDRHAEFALAAIDAGKHVLCEKPLAHTVEDAARICEAAEARGVLVKTGFNHRYFPAVDFARRLIDAGTLGEIRGVRAYAGHPGGEELGHPWVCDPAVTGGGSLVDNGIHILDLARFFLGEVNRAQGCVGQLAWSFDGAEDNGFALFRSASGGIASVHASWTEWRGYRFWVEAVGERGYVRASYPPMLAEWGAVAVKGSRARRRFKLFPAFQVRERLHGWQWTVLCTFVQEMSDLAAGIRAGRSVPATGRDGLRALEMARAVYRSSREGREVEL
ncbi:MAG TPA: Gfo/Idh/MocA family oxidoreductase [Thermoanaerobaculia bacterium]|jgi:predicted dehydrogenase|nr:Gfo/Idh/MocA family oxidoreductase [Thermoanaerobaculia bacterium]